MPLTYQEIRILLQYLEQDEGLEDSQPKQRLYRKLKIELLEKEKEGGRE